MRRRGRDRSRDRPSRSKSRSTLEIDARDRSRNRPSEQWNAIETSPGRYTGMTHRFAHEALDCYKLAVEVARWFRQTSFPRGCTRLKEQGRTLQIRSS